MAKQTEELRQFVIRQQGTVIEIETAYRKSDALAVLIKAMFRDLQQRDPQRLDNLMHIMAIAYESQTGKPYELPAELR